MDDSPVRVKDPAKSYRRKKGSDGLTPLQRGIVIEKIKDSKAKDEVIYRRAGGLAKNPSAAAYNLMRRPEVKHYMELYRLEIVKKIPISRQIKKHEQLLEAKRIQKVGEDSYQEVNDNATQMQALTELYKILGMHDDSTKIQINENQITINVTPEMVELAKARMQSVGMKFTEPS